MRQLGLTVILCELLAFALVGCQTSEPARGTPPSSGTGNPAPMEPNPGAPVASGSRIYDETVQTIEAHPNEGFVIALKANVTTPMEWRIEPAPDSGVVVLSGRNYTDSPPPGCSGCTGYGGTDSFSFAAKGSGETDLRFAYGPLGKKDAPPSRTVTVHVRVVH